MRSGQTKLVRRVSGLVATAAAVSLLWSSAASAATEFGSTCAADAAVEYVTLLQLSQEPENGLPLTAPVSGVITRWSIVDETGAEPGELPQLLQVYRTAGPSTFTLINQTAPTPLVPGLNTIPARLPIQAGDRLGIYSPVQTMYCIMESGNDEVGYVQSLTPLQVGETRTFAGDAPFRIPVRATIEPDADSDGYGDETQDACPQSAATQGVCPPVVLSTGKQVRKGSVTIVVTSSTAAPVSVKGVVKLGKGKKATLNGGTQNLAAGVPGSFKLKFTKKVKKKLKELPPKRSLRLNVTVTGTSLSGAVTTSTLKVKLKGQEK